MGTGLVTHPDCLAHVTPAHVHEQPARLARVLHALSEDGVIARMPGYGWKFQPTLNKDEAFTSVNILIPDKTSIIKKLKKQLRLAKASFQKKSAALLTKINTLQHDNQQLRQQNKQHSALLTRVQITAHTDIFSC